MSKMQLPAVGGIRKVLKSNDIAVGTTIAELGSNTITLAQLAAVLSQIQAQQQNNGGGNIGSGDEATISLGPGLAGGGVLVGNVPIRIFAPLPWFDSDGGGGDGDPGPPGAAGLRGVNGAIGLPGAAIFLAADDGEEGQSGPPGALGFTGATGAAGSTGTTLVYSNTTVPAGNTISNTTSELFFTSAYTILANTLIAGMVIRVKLFGTYSTGVVAPSLTLRFYFGSTLMTASGAVTTVAGVTNDGWSAEGMFIVQTIGATGTVEAQGLSEFSTAVATALIVNMDNTAPITVNTTINELLQVSVQWGGTVNASDTITLREMTVEIMSTAGIPVNTPVPPPPFPVFFGEDGEDGFVGAPGLQGAPGVAGTGTTIAVPGTIADLTYWWSSSAILASAGKVISRLQESTPWIGGIFATNSATTTTVDSAQLNGLNVLKWPPAAGGSYNVTPSTLTSAATFFVVIKPTSTVAAGGQAIIGGAANALAFYLNTASGGSVFALVKTTVSVIGTSSTSWTTGTWVQVNATYTAATGAFAFRQARAAAGSGTGTTLAGTGALQFLGADAATGTSILNSASLAELIIYNRVLIAAEITSVENYLNTKWGV